MTVSQSLVHNRRSFLRMIALGAGAAVLAACGAGATTKSSLTEEERARLEALGDEMAAAMETDTTPKVKIKGSERKTGTVKWYNSAKGYGFITSQSGPDVFVHRRAIVGGIILQEGQIVDYVEVAGQKGPQAEGVELRTP
jgi:CspA family cold shock protein